MYLALGSLGINHYRAWQVTRHQRRRRSNMWQKRSGNTHESRRLRAVVGRIGDSNIVARRLQPQAFVFQAVTRGREDLVNHDQPLPASASCMSEKRRESTAVMD